MHRGRGVARILHWGAQKPRRRGECGLGRGCPPPQPIRGAGGASWAPPWGLGHIWGPQNSSHRENSVSLL